MPCQERCVGYENQVTEPDRGHDGTDAGTFEEDGSGRPSDTLSDGGWYDGDSAWNEAYTDAASYLKTTGRPSEAARQVIQQLPDDFMTREVTNPNIAPATPEGAEGFCQSYAYDSGERNPQSLYSESIVEGWVWKRSRFMRRWRRRYLVLCPMELASHKASGDSMNTETIRRSDFNAVESADKEAGQSNVFCVLANKRKYYMVCDEAEHRDAWIGAITNAFAGGP